MGLQIPWWAQSLFFSLWAFSFFLDVKVTTECKNFLKYETNYFFRFFVRRFGTRKSIAFQILTETGLLVLSSYLFNFRFDVQSMGIVSMVFGLAHLTAWRSNKKFMITANLHKEFHQI